MKSIQQLTDDYPANSRHMGEYIAYQERYKTKPRESDKVLVQHLQARLRKKEPRIMDIGCSTGNLLRVVRTAFPDADLYGVDLNAEQIEHCRRDPSLHGIRFESTDIQALRGGPYDAVTCSAVVFCMDDEGFQRAGRCIFETLAPGGVFVCFDLFHPWEQDLAIVEKSRAFPEGLPLHFRSYASVTALLQKAGFAKMEFHPFQIPIDLPKPDFNKITTFTEKLADGSRLQFRGCLSQPWNHLVAVRQ